VAVRRFIMKSKSSHLLVALKQWQERVVAAHHDELSLRHNVDSMTLRRAGGMFYEWLLMHRTMKDAAAEQAVHEERENTLVQHAIGYSNTMELKNRLIRWATTTLMCFHERDLLRRSTYYHQQAQMMSCLRTLRKEAALRDALVTHQLVAVRWQKRAKMRLALLQLHTMSDNQEAARGPLTTPTGLRLDLGEHDVLMCKGQPASFGDPVTLWWAVPTGARAEFHEVQAAFSSTGRFDDKVTVWSTFRFMHLQEVGAELECQLLGDPLRREGYYKFRVRACTTVSRSEYSAATTTALLGNELDF